MPKSGVTYINPPTAPPVQGMYSRTWRAWRRARSPSSQDRWRSMRRAIPVRVGDLAAQVNHVWIRAL